MARYVREIMNGELFHVGAQEAASNALLGVLALGITGAPVLGEHNRPIGFVAMRDLVGEAAGPKVADRMRIPAITVEEGATIETAAHLLDEHGVHHLVVIDKDGAATGVVGALDVLRGLLGLPVRHPAAFPHRDAAGVSWTDPLLLDLEHAGGAPDGPGLLVLVYGEARRPEVPVWAEACANVRTRLHALIAGAPGDPILARILARDGQRIRFQAAAIGDPAERAAALERAREDVASASGLPSPRR